MNLPSLKALRTTPRRNRAVGAFTAFVFVTSLFTASSVHADSVRINNVVQTLSPTQGLADLKLGVTTATQDPVSKTTSTTTNGTVESPVAGAKPGAAGVQVVQDPPEIGVEIIEAADVEGTICDCGELFVAGGAFPKWPLLFLTAVPLVFLNDCETCDTPPESNPTPTPNSTPTPTPEPASLLLLGSGLLAAGAGLRRRRNRNS
jgi:PEP-CTERM motif